MTPCLFTPRASRELSAAAAWIAADNPAAAENLLATAIDAAKRVTARPTLARLESKLAPSRYRFWSLRGYPYLLVIDTENDPPRLLLAWFTKHAICRSFWTILSVCSVG